MGNSTRNKNTRKPRAKPSKDDQSSIPLIINELTVETETLESNEYKNQIKELFKVKIINYFLFRIL